MVADTKFDLVTGPRRFLARALHLWDPSAAFGQLQNQAYGYLWPMGPFFVVGDLVRLPPWVVQRLWWALLLCVAFFGIAAAGPHARPRHARHPGARGVRVRALPADHDAARPSLRRGLADGARAVGAAAARATRASAGRCGEPRRSAPLVVATCGGVNAIAVVAVLPLGVLWLLTRARVRAAGGCWAGGRCSRRWPPLWWWLPLLLLGRYSPPFLDYIETATITTVPTDLARTLVGESDWVAYFAGIDFQAGQQLVSTPFLMLDAAAVVALGLVGIALRDNPHRRFLTLSLLTGLVLVGFGYAGDLAGFFAAERAEALDGVLAPLRNLHKFDVVLRIPLVLGLAHAMAVLPKLLRSPESPGGTRAAVLAVRAMAVLALVALALPWAQDRIAPRQGVDAVPAYWHRVASYLAETDDGTVALEVPASAFGVYNWGNTHDDVLQGLAESPWAIRNVIPLAQPGNVEFLDAVTRTIESGTPSRTLATYLAANGVGQARGPQRPRPVPDRCPGPGVRPQRAEPVRRHQAGPIVRPDGRLGALQPHRRRPGAVGRRQRHDHRGRLHRRLLGQRAGHSRRSSPIPRSPSVTPGPGSPPRCGSSARPRRCSPATPPARSRARCSPTAIDAARPTSPRSAGTSRPPWAARTRFGSSAPSTSTASTPTRRSGRPRPPGPAESARSWPALRRGTPTGRVPLQIGSHPGAALDDDPATAWRSNPLIDPVGQFWQVTFAQPTDLTFVSVSMPRDGSPVEQLALEAGDRRIVEDAPRPGGSRTYAVNVADASSLKIEAAGRDPGLPGTFATGRGADDGGGDPALPRPAVARPGHPGRRDHHEPRPGPCRLRAHRERAALRRPAGLAGRGR